jgi:CRISPR-associated protein Csd1
MLWVIHLNENGEQPNFIRTSGGRSRRDTGVQLAAPLLRRSGTRIKPQLLADTAEFVLGVPNPSDPERATGRHQEFVELVEACAAYLNDERVQAVAMFLRRVASSGLPDLPLDLQAQDNVTFQVGDIRPIDLETVRGFWARIVPFLGQRGLPMLTKELVSSWLDSDTESNKVDQCLVCEEVKPIARVHPVPIRLPRSVSDQQLSIVTANREAFWSYGLEQSYLAPTCRDCAESYARGINQLAQGEKSYLLIGSTIFLFWTREHVDFDIFTLITNPNPDQIKSLIDSARSSRRQPEIDDTAFYATSLSGSGGRVVVRDWLDTTVEEVQRKLADWFKHQSLVGPWGESPRPFSIIALAGAIVRQLRDIPRSTPRALLRAALQGHPVPQKLLYQAVQRTRAQRETRTQPKVTWSQASLIKLTLLSQPEPIISEGENMEGLNETITYPAYLCGRLLSVLEEVQVRAMPKVNATVADRYYGTASTTPRAVLPYLIRRARPHLSTLRRDNRGAYNAFQGQLDDLLTHFSVDTNFPQVLTPEEQGLFVLGYYHQRAHGRARARERNQARRETTASN